MAEKLVNDDWRLKQGELVGVLKEMDSDSLRMPSLVQKLDETIDPITFMAMFNRNLNWEDNRIIIEFISDRFDISEDVPKEDPFVPKSNRYVISSAKNPEPIWDIVSSVVKNDVLGPNSDVHDFIDQFDVCMDRNNIRISKLTAGLYWCKPEYFLHSDTVDAIGGKDLSIVAKNATTYIQCLNRTRELIELSFPEINIGVWTQQRIAPHERNVWVVRAGESNRLSPEFRSGDYVAFNFGFDDLNLSEVSSVAEAELRIRAHRPNRTDNATRQMSEFLMSVKIGDYVLMPDRDRDFIHHGVIASDPYFGLEGTHRNRRQIAWNDSRQLTREELGWRGRAYGATVNRVRGDMRDRFLGMIKDDAVVVVPAPVHRIYRMPEDSWVPFHLAIAEKLVEGKWWLPEKREALDDMIEKVRWSDPDEVGDDYEHIQWTPDPYSFYLSFNMRTDGTKRLPGYRKVQELLDVGANVPDAEHRVRGLGTHYRFTNPPGDDDIDALWDFFRFVTRFEPTEDEGAAEFVEKYDRVIEVNGFVGQWDITLSYWLYWIDPRKYLLTRRIHRQELGLTAELGLPENINGGQQYLQALRATRSFAESKRKSLLDINRESTTREMLELDPTIGSGDNAYDVGAMLNEGVFLKESQIERMMRILRSKKNLILQGPPGVGKTFIARKLAYVLMGEKGEEAEKRITGVQFHQSYSYEDFVGGFRPDVKDERMVFKPQDGPFLEMCAEAQANPDDDYVMLIDEINRGNLSRVFGELLMLIEADKRKEEHGVTLQHQPERYHSFFVPKNAYIIGTMNLADKSLTGMNVAMRRRFGFYDLEPQFGEPVFKDWLSKTEMPQEMQDRINSYMSKLNTTISKDDSLDFNYAVGHSFFCPPQNEPVDDWDAWYETVVDYEIRPLLREYWFDDPERANGEADKLKRME
ncbi:MAG: AAA family ATPase [Chloroflexi bacterium]|nr:AAA family ATPase [Chloroflexota bacterium]